MLHFLTILLRYYYYKIFLHRETKTFSLTPFFAKISFIIPSKGRMPWKKNRKKKKKPIIFSIFLKESQCFSLLWEKNKKKTMIRLMRRISLFVHPFRIESFVMYQGYWQRIEITIKNIVEEMTRSAQWDSIRLYFLTYLQIKLLFYWEIQIFENRAMN